MVHKQGWFGRPLAALCILAGVTILSVYIIFGSDGKREGNGDTGYRITFRHYGTDAGEMEKTAAIPLEDALSAVPGISRILTQSENGRVRAWVSFNRGDDDYHDAVREAAQRVYETLPSSAQRPEINSAGDLHVPFWTAAVYGTGDDESAVGPILERIVKPALSSIDGAGEVEIAGPGVREIVISLDQEKTAALGLSPSRISGALGSDDALFSGGLLRYGGLEIPLRVDGRYGGIESLGEAIIPLASGGSVRLGAVADIREKEREPDTLSRLDGKRTAIISVTAASGADPGILSGKIKKEIEKFSALPLEFRVLEDRGAEEAAAFRSALKAALEASVLVALATVLLLGRGKAAHGGIKNGLICAGAIPLISIISAAYLCAAGFPVNRKFLAGLAVGIGCAADAVILSAEGFGRARHFSDGGTILRGIWPPLISGAVTTVAAILPLSGFTAAFDTAVIANALGTVAIVSAVMALTLLPPLFLLKNDPENFAADRRGPSSALKEWVCANSMLPLFCGKISRCVTRRFAGLVAFCVKHALFFPAAALLVSAAAIAALAAAGADTAGELSEDSVYAQIEFEGGFLKEEGDMLLASWAEDIKKHSAVREVQTGARTGSGYGLVTFDPGLSDPGGMRSLVRARTIPGAFIYIPEPSPGDRIWTITVCGDDAEKCRELAGSAASLCVTLPHVKETVLNFKEGGPRLTLVPRREIMAQGGIPFSFTADTVRRGVHGPVAYKRTGEGGEIDVRVRFSPSSASAGNTAGALSGDDVLRIPLAASMSPAGSLRVGSLMEAVKSTEVSGIRRENRRRVASFSIRTDPGDPRLFRDKTMASLSGIELPPGYRIEFDPDAVHEAEALSGKFLNFIWAVLFCYMIIAAAEESFVLPLIILSSIPPSLAVPALVLALSGAPINAAAACAFVAVSGMTVNASVISAGELWQAGFGKTMPVYRALRRRIPALLATTGTTIAGALPFLLVRESGNSLIRILALVTVLGVGSSLFCALTLTPSLMNLYFKNRMGLPNDVSFKRVPRKRNSNFQSGVM